MPISDEELKDLVNLVKVDRQAALARATQIGIDTTEKRGLMLALKGIATFLENGGSPSAEELKPQLSKICSFVLADDLDKAYMRTWLVFLDGL
jgi:hypothetical protein